MQPMASATTSKSELSFVLYLYSRVRLRQHGNALPGGVRPLLGLKVSSRVPLQALKHGRKRENAIALQEAPEQVHAQT